MYREFDSDLGHVEERGNRLWFVPGDHPALANFGERHLGIEGEIGTAVALDAIYRQAKRLAARG